MQIRKVPDLRVMGDQTRDQHSIQTSTIDINDHTVTLKNYKQH